MPQHTATFRFYQELNDFLDEHRKKIRFDYPYNGTPAVKDAIEAIGVPHTEVDLVLVNGASVDFSYVINDGDRISVYPVFETLAIDKVTRLRPRPLRCPRFVCDVHLGKLAKRLRLLGFDTVLSKGEDDRGLVGLAQQQERILLTRDRRLLMNKDVTRGLCVRHTDVDKQVHQVLDRFDLRAACSPFTRCTVCNGQLKQLTKDAPAFAEIRERVPARVLNWRNEFSVCSDCGKVYWRGSHYTKLARRVAHYLHVDEGLDKAPND